MPSPIQTALLGLSLLLGGCFVEPGNSFAEETPLPTPEALLAEYGALSPGTFTFRRYEVARDTGRVFTGTALFGPSGSSRNRALCLREGNVRIAYLGTRSPDPVTPGFHTGLRPSFNIESYEYGVDTFIFVADTSGGYIRGVFASRTKSIGVTQDFFTSIIQGGFNASAEEMTSC